MLRERQKRPSFGHRSLVFPKRPENGVICICDYGGHGRWKLYPLLLAMASRLQVRSHCSAFPFKPISVYVAEHAVFQFSPSPTFRVRTSAHVEIDLEQAIFIHNRRRRRSHFRVAMIVLCLPQNLTGFLDGPFVTHVLPLGSRWVLLQKTRHPDPPNFVNYRFSQKSFLLSVQ